MNEPLIHADRTQAALVHGGQLPWHPSPEAGVERRRLERIGGEVALATSIVRYLPGRRFPPHVHGLGEEFLVLEGTFCDEHGRYPAGSYIRNPPGSRHAPYSETGCVIFVKLRQMHPSDRQSVRLLPADLAWHPTGPGHLQARLHEHNGVSVQLERLRPGAVRAATAITGGEEIFVIDGQLEVEGESRALVAWSWLRQPGRLCTGLSSPTGASYWRKCGHLKPSPGIRDC